VIAGALSLLVTYVLVGFVVRAVVQARRTGDFGWRGLSGRLGSPEWWAGVGFIAALVAGALGPVAAILGLDRIEILAAPAIQASATVVAVLGIVVTFVTQAAMGTSWRIGVDNSETTDLVIHGPFAVVRNPVFAAMGLFAAGLAFMVPNVVSLCGLALLVVAVQLQVRVVEEPYRRRTHGEVYAGYQAAVGRFLPRLGRRQQHTTVRA
jgi:protein-S-isoprenylcysteine O-methyltransferase Ste14